MFFLAGLLVRNTYTTEGISLLLTTNMTLMFKLLFQLDFNILTILYN